MGERIDPVDRALSSLGGREWPGTNLNPELEYRLMESFENHPRASLLARHRVLTALLAVLILGSAGLAAAGGVELTKR